MLKNEYLFNLDTCAAHIVTREERTRGESAAPCQINKNNSVFNSNNDIFKFGISKTDLEYCNLKIKRQRDWLAS